MLFAAAFGGCGATRPYRAHIQSDDVNERILGIREAAERGDRFAVPLLVDRLEDEDGAVRFFAILALDRLTGRRFGYDYAQPAAARAPAVERWRQFVRNRRHLQPPGADADDRGEGISQQIESPPRDKLQ